jgi:hypothetical protein
MVGRGKRSRKADWCFLGFCIDERRNCLGDKHSVRVFQSIEISVEASKKSKALRCDDRARVLPQ